MAAIPYESLKVTEDHGIITSASASYYIKTLVGGLLPFEVMQEAMLDPDIPVVGSIYSATISNLMCTRRTPSIEAIDDGIATVKVDVEWETVRTSVVPWPVSGGSTLNQQETSTQRDGTTRYTSGKFDYTYETKTFYGKIQPLMPQCTVRHEIIETTNSPEQMVMRFAGTVNTQPWHSGDAGEWMCAAVDFAVLDEQSLVRQYKFGFTFEWKPYPGHSFDLYYLDTKGDRPSTAAATRHYYYYGLDFQDYFPDSQATLDSMDAFISEMRSRVVYDGGQPGAGE